jgi:hypothetical protein
MSDASRHPADDVLYDLVEGTLDDARAQDVGRHVARCAACAAFVDAARSGAAATSGPIPAMPADAVAALDRAVAGAWRERVAGIAAAEQVADSVTPPFETAQLIGVDRPTTAVPVASTEAGRVAPQRRRARWLVPALAFVVLGALAGTSWRAGEQRPGAGTDAASKPSAVSADETASTASAPSSVESSAPASSLPDPSTQAQEAGRAATSAPEGVAADTAISSGNAAVGAGSTAGSATGAPPLLGDTSLDGIVAPPVKSEGGEGDGVLTCIATRDETRLYLPDGRVVQLVTSGPLGIYVVCG